MDPMIPRNGLRMDPVLAVQIRGHGSFQLPPPPASPIMNRSIFQFSLAAVFFRWNQRAIRMNISGRKFTGIRAKSNKPPPRDIGRRNSAPSETFARSGKERNIFLIVFVRASRSERWIDVYVQNILLRDFSFQVIRKLYKFLQKFALFFWKTHPIQWD